MVAGFIQVAESVHSSDDVIVLHLDGLNNRVIFRVRSELSGENHVVSSDLPESNFYNIWKNHLAPKYRGQIR